MRVVQNWIGGNDYNPCDADFVPPPPENVLTLVEDLAAFCSDDLLPPLVQAAIAHAQFETIHPFDDGNGRTGRALVQVILRRRGIAPHFVPPVSVVLARNKRRYIEGLTGFREERLAGWLRTFAAAPPQAPEPAPPPPRYAKRVHQLQEDWRERLRTSSAPRVDAVVWPLISTLVHPILSVPIGVAATQRTRPTPARKPTRTSWRWKTAGC